MTAMEFRSDSVQEPNPIAGLSFKLDDETFTCKGRISMLDLSDLSAAAVRPETRDAAETGAVAEMLRQALGPEEYGRFKAHCREHETPDEVQLNIIQAVNEAIQAAEEARGDRPTRQPSPSSPGQRETAGRMSRAISRTGQVVITEGG